MRIALLCLALAGCATPQPLPVLTPDVAQQMPAAQLCLGLSTFRANNAATAQAEITRRGINCQDHAQAVQMLQQQRAQAAGIILQNQLSQPVYQPYQLPPPPPIQPPRQINCTSRNVGGTVYTDCR